MWDGGTSVDGISRSVWVSWAKRPTSVLHASLNLLKK